MSRRGEGGRKMAIASRGLLKLNYYPGFILQPLSMFISQLAGIGKLHRLKETACQVNVICLIPVEVQLAPLHTVMPSIVEPEKRQTAAARSGTKVNKSSGNSLQSAGGRQPGRSLWTVRRDSEN